MASLTELRVGLIGAGNIARDQHLPGWKLVPEARVVAAADPAAEAVESLAREFGIDARYQDYRRLLEDPSIDAVDICCPSALHAEAAIAALQAGKHVLCEKPLATSRTDAAAVLAAVKASGQKLMVGQQFRFEPSTLALQHHLATCDIGPVYFGRGQWLRRRRLPGRPGFTQKRLSGGGPVYDLGVHLLDLSWWLMNCPRPISVSGAAFNHLARRGDLTSEWGTWDPATIDVEDFACGLIRFAGGGVLSLEVSWLGFQPEAEMWRLQLFGVKGGVVWPQGLVSGETEGRPWDVQLAPPRGPRSHHETIRQFGRAVVDDQPVPIPPEQSANVIAMLEALYRSAASGKEAAVELIE